MADGTKLRLNRTRFQVRTLYLRPNLSFMKCGFRGWLGSCVIIRALRVMASVLRSERLEVGSPMIFEALFVMRVSLFLSTTSNMLWKQGEQ